MKHVPPDYSRQPTDEEIAIELRAIIERLANAMTAARDRGIFLAFNIAPDPADPTGPNKASVEITKKL